MLLPVTAHLNLPATSGATGWRGASGARIFAAGSLPAGQRDGVLHLAHHLLEIAIMRARCRSSLYILSGRQGIANSREEPRGRWLQAVLTICGPDAAIMPIHFGEAYHMLYYIHLQPISRAFSPLGTPSEGIQRMDNPPNTAKPHCRNREIEGQHRKQPDRNGSAEESTYGASRGTSGVQDFVDTQSAQAGKAEEVSLTFAFRTPGSA